MPRTVLAALVALMLGAGACSTRLDMQIQAGQRPGTDFSRFATYAWNAAGVVAPEWPARDERAALDWQLRGLVDQQMARRGWALVGHAGADLLVDYRIDTREGRIEDTFGDFARYRAQGGTQSPGQAWVSGYEQGTLVIEVSDAKAGQLVWYGSATAVVNPKLREQRLPIAVQRIFERFPARTAAATIRQ